MRRETAADHCAQGDDVAKARTLVDIAADDPTLADFVRDLRKILDGPTPMP
jgi:hypothetical protein